ncbi:Compound eye opsin BCRH1 [Orchesella cincta]|uniref:Compound eye opsin BCRH1 n=1 Tax=Orchesella cincta TaxID=48709 RepID=A0A1D2N6K9_ORCCI|nr:Compound eye opsin BCRH1 [Orchesella cincta]
MFVCVLIWVLSLGLVIPPFVGWSKYVIEGVGTSCSWDYTSRDFRNRVYYIFLLTFGFFVPVSIIIISYFGILQVVCKQSSRMNGFSRNGGISKKSPTRSDMKTAQKSAVLVAIIFLGTSHGQKCQEGNSIVDLMFVVDRTPNPDKLASHPGGLLNDVQVSLQNRFPGSRFGLTLFSDFTNSQKGDPAGDTDDDKSEQSNYCYRLKSSLKERLDYQNAFKGIKKGPDGGKGQESVLTGILYTAADKSVGWSKINYNKKAQRVIKLLAFITGSESLSDQVHNLPNKPTPKGDGKDDCDNFGLPSTETINSILNKKQMGILGILTNETVIPYWEKELKSLTNVHQETQKLTISDKFDPSYAAQTDELTEKIVSLIGQYNCFLDPPGKSTVILSIIVCFLVSWTPYAICSMIGQFGDASLLSPLATALPAIFAKSSVIYNPFVYGLSHPLFRTAFATLKAKYLGKRNAGGITANPRLHHHCPYCHNKHPSRKIKLVVTARGDGTYNTTYDHRHRFHLDGQKMQAEGFRGKIPKHLRRHFAGNAECGERAGRCSNEDKSSDPQTPLCQRSKDCTMEQGMTLSTMQTTPCNSVKGRKNLRNLKKGVWIFKNANECQPSGSDATARTAVNTCNESSDGGELETSLSIRRNPYAVHSNGDGRSMKNSYTFFMCEYRKRRQDAIQHIFFQSENCLNDLFTERAGSNAPKSHLSTSLGQGVRMSTCTHDGESKCEQCESSFETVKKAASYHSIDNRVISEFGAGIHTNNLNLREDPNPKRLFEQTRHSICCAPTVVNSDVRRHEFSLVCFNRHDKEGKTVGEQLKNQNGTFRENYKKVRQDLSSCQYQREKEGKGNANTMLRRNLYQTKTYLSAGDMEKAARDMIGMSNGMSNVGKKKEIFQRLRKSVSLSGLKVTAVESGLPLQTTVCMANPAISEFALNDLNEPKESTKTRMSEITSFRGLEIDSGSCSWCHCHNNSDSPFSSADEQSRHEDIDPLQCSGSLYASCNSDLCSLEDKLTVNYA